MAHCLGFLHSAGQFEATSPDLTLNGGVHREQRKNDFKLGFEILETYPACCRVQVYP